MSEAKTGAGLAERPTSPHLQVWRWHVTMWGSILHRVSGIALYGGALILAGWVAALASGPGVFMTYKALLGSIPGKLALFVLTLAIFYHLANGLRHLVWDFGKGFEPRTADMTGAAVIAFAIAASLAVWGLAFVSGALA